MIKFEHVGLRYGVGPEVLSDVTFTLEPGSFHFLTGPSGAGKTSLLRLMYLGMKPTRGVISMFGRDVGSMSKADLVKTRQRIGVVFQDFRLMPHLSVFDNVALPLRIMGARSKDVKEHVDELLDWVGLGDYKNALPLTLSGGQQQRVSIARAVISRPRLLLADEPTGNLDDEIGYRLMRLFDQLNRMGTTLIVATHNKQLMDEFGHPSLMLNDGQLHVHNPTPWIDRAVEGAY